VDEHGHVTATLPASGGGDPDTVIGLVKASVAEIMAAVAHLYAHPERPRLAIRICFTPDIGEGFIHVSELTAGAHSARIRAIMRASTTTCSPATPTFCARRRSRSTTRRPAHR
jgi:hypothetical protein